MDHLHSAFQDAFLKLDALLSDDGFSPNIKRDLRALRISIALIQAEVSKSFHNIHHDAFTLHAYRITPAEIRVYQEIVNGLLTREIARKLHLSETTVKSHIQSIYSKVGVRNRAESVAKGIEIGLRKIQ